MDLLLSVQADALNLTQELNSCSVLHPVLLFILFILRCKHMQRTMKFLFEYERAVIIHGDSMRFCCLSGC